MPGNGVAVLGFWGFAISRFLDRPTTPLPSPLQAAAGDTGGARPSSTAATAVAPAAPSALVLQQTPTPPSPPPATITAAPAPKVTAAINDAAPSAPGSAQAPSHEAGHVSLSGKLAAQRHTELQRNQAPVAEAAATTTALSPRHADAELDSFSSRVRMRSPSRAIVVVVAVVGRR